MIYLNVYSASANTASTLWLDSWGSGRFGRSFFGMRELARIKALTKKAFPARSLTTAPGCNALAALRPLSSSQGTRPCYLNGSTPT
jgi:hypothetical protein